MFKSNLGLLILQWNACRIILKSREFMNVLLKLEKLPGVVCLQETFLKEQSIIFFPGYSILRKDGENGWGGVAFLIRKEMSCMDVQVLNVVKGIDVKIPTVSGNLEIVNISSSSSSNFYYNFFFFIYYRTLYHSSGSVHKLQFKSSTASQKNSGYAHYEIYVSHINCK